MAHRRRAEAQCVSAGLLLLHRRCRAAGGCTREGAMWVPGRCLLTCSGTCMKKEHDRALLAGSGVGVSLCHQGRAMGRDLACATALWVTSPYSYSHRVSGGGTAVACRVSGVLSRERNLYALDFLLYTQKFPVSQNFYTFTLFNSFFATRGYQHHRPPSRDVADCGEGAARSRCHGFAACAA